jgi:hypothetical protein
MASTPGSSTDHRPDLKQAVFARMGAPDGGVPVMRNRWEGPAADTPMFQARAHALMAILRAAPNPRYVVAEATLDTEDKAPNLAKRDLLTRIPGTLTRVTQGSTPALQWDPWPSLHARTRAQRLEVCHDRMAPRGLVVVSPAARERAEASVNHACPREAEALSPPRCQLQAQRFETPTPAHAPWSGWARPGRSHQVDSYARLAHKREGTKGRPTAAPPRRAIAGPMPAQGRLDAKRLAAATHPTAGVGLGPHIEPEPRSDAEVIAGDNAPSPAEGGFRVRNDPWCFVSSWLVKQPCRSQGLVMVMPLALLV